jgi:MerE protein
MIDAPTTLPSIDPASRSGSGPACRLPRTPEQAEKRGMLWLAGAFVLCPCHLPLTLALAAALLSGTAAATTIHDHPFAAGAIVTLAWGAGTWRGFHHLASAQKYAKGIAQRSRPSAGQS